MSERPHDAGLLLIARSLLREEVLPTVAPARRYEVAMIANAMAIAAREMAEGNRIREAERAALAAFYAAPGAELAALRRRLCADLRARTLAPAAEQRLRSMLAAAVAGRLAISNPGHRQRGTTVTSAQLAPTPHSR